MASAIPGPSKRKQPPAEKLMQNIKVNVRVRPLNRNEIDANVRNVIRCPTYRDIVAKEKKFLFDRVYKPEASQIEVYQGVVAPLIPDVMAGYNCTVFAYGQTGSGKTYTMSGDNCECPSNWREDPTAGCIPRAAAHIFEFLDKDKDDTIVKVSYLELYNEEIRDLLSDDEGVLTSIFDTSRTAVRIQGLREVSVQDSGELCRQLQRGNLRRQSAPTLMNHQSSRSHTVFAITVDTRQTSISGEDIIKTGKINLVDLAGSENIARSGCKDVRAVELVNINKSLLTLGRVIHTLADKTQRHVPYRDSKLTRILKDSLGGHTKTCIIATVSPASNSYEETVNTLEYASRAKDIKNQPIVNETLSKSQIISNLHSELDKMRRDLDAARDKTGFYINKENYDKLIEEMEAYTGQKLTLEEAKDQQQQRIEALEQEMKAKGEEFDQTVMLCKKKGDMLARAKRVIKENKMTLHQERFVSDVYEEEAVVLHKKAETLLMTAEVLSDQKKILQDKLEKQFMINTTIGATAYTTVNETLSNLQDVSAEEVSLSATEREFNEACRLDIEQLENEISGPLTGLQEVIENFTTTGMKNVYVQQSITEKLKAHLVPLTSQLDKFRDELTVHGEQLKLFEEDDIPSFIHDYRAMADSFLGFTDSLLNMLDNNMKEQDSVMYRQFDKIEKLVQKLIDHEEDMYRRRQEHTRGILEAAKASKSILTAYNYTAKNDPTIISQVATKREQLKKNEEALVTKIRLRHQERVAGFVEVGSVQEIIKGTEKVRQEVEAGAASLDADIVSNQKAVTSLGTTLQTEFKKITEGVVRKTSNFMQNLNKVTDTRKKFHIKLTDFMARTTQTLKADLLNKVVPVTHEGDTPARQHIDVDRFLKCPPPREDLLRKFQEERLITLEEDKENHRDSLNVSGISFTDLGVSGSSTTKLIACGSPRAPSDFKSSKSTTDSELELIDSGDGNNKPPIP